jgi:hypothetical protein
VGRQLVDVAGPRREAEVVLPASLFDAVRVEIHRAFRPPYETPIVVLVNGALMSSAWFFLPKQWKDWLFTLHGSLAFALVLATWMYSDVPATNVLAPDRNRVLAARDDPVLLRRLISAKNIVLWLMITPLCSIVAVITGLLGHDPAATFLTIVWIGIVPFGALGLSAWIGIRFPYHPMPLRFRWEHRRPWWRMVGRWLSLAVTPYVVVPVLASLLMAPTLALWGLLSEHGLTHKIPDRDLWWGVGVACIVAAVCWVGGLRVSSWLIARRRAQLVEFMNDPTRG